MSTIRASVWVFIMPIPCSWTNVTFRRTVRPFTPIWDITSWSIITWVTWGIQSFRHGNSLRVRVSRWSTIGIGVSIGWWIIIRITWILTISNLYSKLYISRTLNTQMDIELITLPVVYYLNLMRNKLEHSCCLIHNCNLSQFWFGFQLQVLSLAMVWNNQTFDQLQRGWMIQHSS